MLEPELAARAVLRGAPSLVADLERISDDLDWARTCTYLATVAS